MRKYSGQGHYNPPDQKTWFLPPPGGLLQGGQPYVKGGQPYVKKYDKNMIKKYDGKWCLNHF